MGGEIPQFPTCRVKRPTCSLPNMVTNTGHDDRMLVTRRPAMTSAHIILMKGSVVVGAMALLAMTVAAQTAKDVKGATPLVAWWSSAAIGAGG